MPDEPAAPRDQGAFQLIATDSLTRARRGVVTTRRGPVNTPAFMPVGTQATVKALDSTDVRRSGSEILLCNTYHLVLRPGREIIEQAGGLHPFMNWPRPILTDSGGFQIFSLARRRRVTEQGVDFRSHLDGRLYHLSPESAIEAQLGFGSDIIMPLDELVGFEADDADQCSAMQRTHRWLRRGVRHFRCLDPSDEHGAPLLFGIAQGGFDASRRRESASYIAAQAVDGCAIGGLSVGESKHVMAEMLDASIDALPVDRPRYLMGVGSPEDLWRGVAAGVDMFDCVHPTRVARRGALFTPFGRINITSSRFQEQFAPIDEDCDCETCRSYSAAYLNHLFRAKELLAYRLASIHNLRFIQREMERMRAAIVAGDFARQLTAFLDRYQPANQAYAREQRAAWSARTRERG